MRVPEILPVPLPEVPPVKPAPTGTDHEYVVAAGTVPSVPFTGVAVNVAPLQTVAVISLITGIGLIVTVSVKAEPVHDPETGVTEYVAV